MRRDLIIGIIVSVLLHGGVFGLGLFKSPPKQQKPKEEEKLIQIEMPPIEPDEPEKVDPEDQPEEIAEVAPPMLTDVPQIAPPDAFIQKIEPPPPEGMKPNVGAITIPQGRIGGKGLGEVFDLNNLDQVPMARLQSKPIYPFEMRRAGITGTVNVGFIVDANGDVQNAYAINSTQREFESAAVLAVSKWKFRPGRRGGRAVATRMQVPIVFSIADE